MMKNDIGQAAEILRQGGLVAIPTETVYGLGADARNPDALRKIFAAKGRPQDHPLIVHLADISQLTEWACDISETAMILAKTFWPGPMTLILKKSPHVNDLVTGRQDTIGLRIPNHPVALELLKQYGGGIAAPSANRFGHISPTTAQAVYEELGDAVDMILEGGQCEVGVESTIVDVSGEHPVILRPGMIRSSQIEQVLHQQIGTKGKNAPRVSGSLESHYAPTTKTRLVATDQLTAVLQAVQEDQLPLAVVGFNHINVTNSQIQFITMSRSADTYAHDLYRVLRDLDKENLREIIIEAVPESPEWDAIRDRLQRATA